MSAAPDEPARSGTPRGESEAGRASFRSGPAGGLGGRLGAIAAAAGRELAALRVRAVVTRAADRAAPVLVIVPAVAVSLELARRAGIGVPSLAGWPLLATTLGLPLLALLAAGTRAALRPVDARDALAAVDRRRGYEDRLLTAHEFLTRGARGHFEQAALDDARRLVATESGAGLELRHEPWRAGRRLALHAAASVALMLAVAWLGTWATLDPEATDERLAAAAPTLRASETPPPEQAPPPSAPRVDGTQRIPMAPTPAAREQAVAAHDLLAELAEETKESKGKTAQGRSAEAQSASGSSQSRGAPSNQAQTSKSPDKKPAPAPPKRLEKPEDRPIRKSERRNEEESGATAGRGSARGSNRNPAVSSWSSKDQVTTQDDQEIEEDEETEDEDEDQDARGGVQPSLRDRRPPVSRDLRIGFGNQPSPDANGRGGPSQHKKSRGTASLVLGVPIPDRVKGQPNPGKTKITQERIEPEAEDAEPIEAAARTARGAPVGHLSRPELAPWMRDLVRSYFLTLRQNPEGTP